MIILTVWQLSARRLLWAKSEQLHQRLSNDKASSELFKLDTAGDKLLEIEIVAV